MKNSSLILSIIIPVYNVEKYISKCLDTCLKQNIDSNVYEIVIVNDGATDSSHEVISKYLGCENIKYIKQANQGLSGARNTGLSKAKGEYIWFVDSDDWITENCLGQIINLLINNKLDILEFDHIYTVEDKNKNLSYTYDPFYHSIKEDKVVSGIEFVEKHSYIVSVTNKIIRRSIFIDNKLSFPQNRFSEDNIVALILMHKSNRYMKLDTGYYYYYSREGSITKKKDQGHLFKYMDDQILNIKDILKYLDDELLVDTPFYKKVYDNISFISQNVLFLCLTNKWFEKFAKVKAEFFNLGITKFSSTYRTSLKRRLFAICLNFIFLFK